MANPLPLLDSSDPRLKLMVQNRVRNVFVTQPEDNRWACASKCKGRAKTFIFPLNKYFPVFLCRHKKEENVKYIPVVTEVRHN